MSLHSGSSALAHNLDRFDFRSDFELVAAEAARLQVGPGTVRLYRDWYGNALMNVAIKRSVYRMPAYEARIRSQILGEPIRFIDQVAHAA
jgi:hypothetical protein